MRRQKRQDLVLVDEGGVAHRAPPSAQAVKWAFFLTGTINEQLLVLEGGRDNESRFVPVAFAEGRPI